MNDPLTALPQHDLPGSNPTPQGTEAESLEQAVNALNLARAEFFSDSDSNALRAKLYR